MAVVLWGFDSLPWNQCDASPLWAMADVSHDDGFHGACDPDTCFAAKMAYMREHGGLSVHYPYGGRKVFSGPTLGERIRREQAMAKAAGNEIRPVNPLYDRPAKFKVDT